MKKTLICAILMAFCAVSADAEIPIIAYGGVLPKESTVERFQEFRNAGFDVSISNFADLPTSAFIRALDNAQKCNVRLFALSSELWEYPEATIIAIKNHPALYGYYIYDEPFSNQMTDMKKRYDRFRRADSSKPFYMNLIPYYDDGLLRRMRIANYRDYVRSACNTGVPQICFDYYPITKSGIRSKWYMNLEIIRNESLRTNRPFWAFALSTPHADYPQPTLEMLRLQMYTNLAYGAKALLYFTYWTPPRTKDFIFRNGPIDVNGKRTKTYDVVRSMNMELRPLLPLFDKGTVTSVQHLGNHVSEGTTPMKTVPLNVSRLVVYGSQGAVVSNMKADGHEYLVVVNKDYKKHLGVHIEAKSMVVHIDKTLQARALKNDYDLGGGDMIIFRLQ